MLVVNGIVYVTLGLATGRFRRKLLPISPRAVLHDIGEALRGRLAHDNLAVYNAAQRAAYLALIVCLALLVASGLSIWKPVQLHWLALLFGDYEGARYVHFFAMSAVALIVLVHVVMVFAVDPWSLRAITTGGYDESKSPEARNARPFFWRRAGSAPEAP